MNIKTFAQAVAISGAALGFATTSGLADQGHCRPVGGGILTNFLPKADCGSSPVGLCTDGPATGVFQGATGNISAFGAIDENKGQLTLRYAGTVCFAPVTAE